MSDWDELSPLEIDNARLRADLAAEREKAFTAMRVFERYRELEATIDKLREALEPFAKGVQSFSMTVPDAIDVEVTAEDIRHARAVLKETGGGDE
jgi:tetrahydromethanopterin S-methyltransferase subunit B